MPAVTKKRAPKKAASKPPTSPARSTPLNKTLPPPPRRSTPTKTVSKPPKSLKPAPVTGSSSSLSTPRFANLLTWDPVKQHLPLAPTLKGTVKAHFDRTLNKNIYLVRGTPNTSHYLATTPPSLNIKPSFIYLVVKIPAPPPTATTPPTSTIHIDFTTTASLPFRITLSTFEKTVRLAGRGLRVPLSLFKCPPGTWQVLALDIPTIVSKYGRALFQLDQISHVTSVKVCSCVNVLGVWGGAEPEVLCTANEVARAVKVERAALDGGITWFPKCPVRKVAVDNADADNNGDDGREEKVAEKGMVSSMKLRSLASPKASAAAITTGNESLTAHDTPSSPPVPPRPKNTTNSTTSATTTNSADDSNILTSPPVPPRPRQSNSSQAKGQLFKKVFGVGSVDELHFSTPGAVVYKVNNVIITQTSDQQQFRVLPEKVHRVAVSLDGKFMATCSVTEVKVYDNRQSDVRRPPVGTYKLEIPPKELNVVQLSPVDLQFSVDTSMLCIVCYDRQRRLGVTVFDMKGIQESASSGTDNEVSKVILPVIARQTSDFPISAMRFSPYETGKLVSCGGENVRFWRIKAGHLPACPAILNEFARGVKFTAVAFESSYGMLDDAGSSKIVFVGCDKGTVLQISYRTRNVICVLKLHDGPVNCLQVNEGYAVTGGGDGFLRLWPLDFSDYLLEAKHESGVTAVTLSMDGLNLLVGTEMGTVGVLDVVTQKYETVVRSHDGGILSCCRVNDNVATVGLDCTVRVWEIHSRRQEKEFVSPHDEPRTIEYHPFQDVIACGFVSGFVRIFSLESISTLFELEQHTGVVKCLKYTKDGNLLYSAATDGHISIYDVTQDYLPIKTIACDVPSSCVKMCLSDCGSYLAAVGPELHAVTVYEARSLVVVKKLVRAGEEKEVVDMFFYDGSPGTFNMCVFAGNRVSYFEKVTEKSGGRVIIDTLPFQGAVGVVSRSNSRASFACVAKENEKLGSVFVCDLAPGGGGRQIRERARLVGQWGGVTGLAWDERDETLLASDDTGVMYVWEVAKGKEGEKKVAEIEVDAIESPPGGADARESIKMLAAPSPVASSPPRAAPVSSPTPSHAQVSGLVLDEMLRRSWVSQATAARMASPECAQHKLLNAAVEAFLINRDFEELLDTFLITSKHVEGEDNESASQHDFASDNGGSIGDDGASDSDNDGSSRSPPDLFALTRIAGFSPSAPLLWNQTSGLLAYAADNTVVLEDLDDSSQTFASHPSDSLVTSFDISSDGQYLVTAATASDDSLQVWSTIRSSDSHALEDMLSLELFDSVGVLCVAFCNNDELVVAVTPPSPHDAQKLVVWDFLKTSSVARVYSLSATTVALLSLSNATGLAFVTGGDDGVYLWSLDDDRAYNDGTPSKMRPSESMIPENRLASIPVADGEQVTAICQHHSDRSLMFAGTSESKIVMYELTADAVLKSWSNMSSPVAVTGLQHKASGLFAESLGVVSLWGDNDSSHPVSVITVKGGARQMQWDDAGVEGVVGTSDNVVKYLKLGANPVDPLEDDIELLQGSCVDVCVFSPDSTFVCAASSTAITIYESDTLKPITRCKASAKPTATATSVACGSTSSNGSFLVAAAFTDWTIQVVRVLPQARTNGSISTHFTLPRSPFAAASLNLAFVDHDNYLATSDDTGELNLWPIDFDDEGYKQAECFDLLAHEKRPLNWTWTSMAVHPDDSTTWCCAKLLTVDGKSSAQLYVFQQGQNSHIVSVLDTFSSDNNPCPEPEHFSVAFSTTTRGGVVVALGQQDSSCVIQYDMLGGESPPTVTNIVQLGDCVVSLGMSADNLIGCGFDDGRVFVMSEDACDPLDTVEVGARGVSGWSLGRGNAMVVGGAAGPRSFTFMGGEEEGVEEEAEEDSQ